MILLFDADSLIWSSCYRGKRYTKYSKNKSPFYDDIEDVKFKYDEVFMSMINKLEEHVAVDKIITFAGSRGNFRKAIDPNYKANRKDGIIPPLLGELQEYVKKSYKAVSTYGYETDDLVASYWYKYKEDAIIISIDKDYRQFPALIYNYHNKHQTLIHYTDLEALYFFYEQMIVGDGADNVNFCKGYGQAYAKKIFKNCDSAYKFRKQVYLLYKKIYKGKAREKYVLCYNLLKLRTNLEIYEQ